MKKEISWVVLWRHWVSNNTSRCPMVNWTLVPKDSRCCMIRGLISSGGGKSVSLSFLNWRYLFAPIPQIHKCNNIARYRLHRSDRRHFGWLLIRLPRGNISTITNGSCSSPKESFLQVKSFIYFCQFNSPPAARIIELYRGHPKQASLQQQTFEMLFAI